jgi:hypothetical protein
MARSQIRTSAWFGAGGQLYSSHVELTDFQVLDEEESHIQL